MSCSDCTRGVLSEGAPLGSMSTLGDIPTYVTLPVTDYDETKAVLFLSDIFGFYVNSKLVADSFAANGFPVYLPDLFNNDPVSIEDMNQPGFTLDAWRVNHTSSHTTPIIIKAVEAMRAKGIQRLGVVGYCYGGKYAFDLAIDNKVEACMMAHPSGITKEDIQQAVAHSRVPILFNACETDQTWPKELQDYANAAFPNYVSGFKQNYYKGCTHGFATRGDVSIPAIKFGKEKAFEETVAWFNKYLG